MTRMVKKFDMEIWIKGIPEVTKMVIVEARVCIVSICEMLHNTS